MSTDLTEVFVDLHLNYYEARMVRTALEKKRKQFERNSRAPFIAEAGKIDRNKSGKEMTTAIIDRLNQALDQSIAVAKAPTHQDS